MGSQRSHDDTWDIASSVGTTAVLVAAARARETEGPDPLIRDPYAGLLVAGAGTGVWGDFLDPAMQERISNAGPQVAVQFANMLGYLAVRTHFFDAFFAEASDSGIRQIVILASGLDSRAYRLPWPQGTVVFEIDQPKVLEYKAATMADHGVQPAAELHEVAVDLRQDWPAALKAAGFEPSHPTAWLAEGLLMYLPADAQDRLFDHITELSAPGSRVSAEAVRHEDEERRARMRQRWDKIADDMGIERTVDIAELTYNDPHRADLVEWLNEHGWTASGTLSVDEMRRLGRYVEAPEPEDARMPSTFVIGRRL